MGPSGLAAARHEPKGDVVDELSRFGERRSRRAVQRERVRAEHTTLNEQFRRWLADYVRQENRAEAAMTLVQELRGQVRTGGRKFTRDEMNER